MFGQLGQLQLLSTIGYVPEIVLASSGGNFASYVAMAAKWKYHGIERIGTSLRPSLFCSSWFGIGFVDAVCAYFSGSVFNSGTDTLSFMDSVFTPSSIRSIETWTGMYNRKRKLFRMACNKTSTLLNPKYIDTQIMKTYYPDSMEEICNVCVASASIPAIVPSVKIENEEYEDGGIASASPLTFLKGPIRKLGPNLHMTYINTYNFSETGEEEDATLPDNLIRSTSNLIRSLTMIDVSDARTILAFYTNGDIESLVFPCTTYNLEVVEKMKQVVGRSMLEIYPSHDIEVPISTFTSDQVREAMKDARETSMCRFMYPSSTGLDELIPQLDR